MNYLVIALRIIHVSSAIFWVGSAVTNVFFIGPTVSATADVGQKFMGYLMNKGRLTFYITASAILTVLAGLSLYWIDSSGFSTGWWRSSVGIGFGIGGLAGIVAFVVGSIIGKNMAAMGKIASQIQGKPSPEQLSQIQAIQKQLAVIGPIHTVAEVIAVVCMATARYWMF